MFLKLTPLKTNMTMENQPFVKTYLLLKVVIIHCHVSFLGGKSNHHSSKLQVVGQARSTLMWRRGVVNL